MERRNDLCSSRCVCGVAAEVAIEKGRRCDELGDLTSNVLLRRGNVPRFSRHRPWTSRGGGGKKRGRTRRNESRERILISVVEGIQRGWRKGREWISANKITDFRSREEMQMIIFLAVKISQINFFFDWSKCLYNDGFILYFHTFIFISLCCKYFRYNISDTIWK